MSGRDLCDKSSFNVPLSSRCCHRVGREHSASLPPTVRLGAIRVRRKPDRTPCSPISLPIIDSAGGHYQLTGHPPATRGGHIITVSRAPACPPPQLRHRPPLLEPYGARAGAGPATPPPPAATGADGAKGGAGAGARAGAGPPLGRRRDRRMAPEERLGEG